MSNIPWWFINTEDSGFLVCLKATHYMMSAVIDDIHIFLFFGLVWIAHTAIYVRDLYIGVS